MPVKTSQQTAYNADGQRILKEYVGHSWQFYVMDGMQTLAVLDQNGLSHFNIVGNGTEGRVSLDGSNLTDRRYYLKDHLGSTREVISASGATLETFDYYPFGLLMPKRNTTDAGTLEQYTGKERDTEADLNLDYFGARYYDAAIGRWNGVDPLADKYPTWSPYNYSVNNPINVIDPDGMDWYDINGEIEWYDHEGEMEMEIDGETKTFQSLGKNVLVATHNRDGEGNEEVNSATFELYLEENKDGATATIEGNTVPADIENMNTLAEGVYDMEYYEYTNDERTVVDQPRFIIFQRNEDGSVSLNLQTTDGGTMNDVYFHPGNTSRPSLITNAGAPISEGCQCGPSSQGSYSRYLDFMKNWNVTPNKGKYYLRPSPSVKVKD